MGISKVRGYNFHPWAVCITTGCSWQADPSSMTRVHAKQHAAWRGHHVQIVQENHDHWAPNDYDFETQDKSHEELEQLDLGRGYR